MQTLGAAVRIVLTIGVTSLVAGCVQPGYVQPGPIALQPYPPPVSYQSSPDYRPPISGPIPLQAAPLVQPLPPPTPAPAVTDLSTDGAGPIPVQEMPPLAPDPAAPSTDAASAPTQAAPEAVRKIPASGPGNNVPLEGFRPMKGQTRPTP
jgi:hypothetical protein